MKDDFEVTTLPSSTLYTTESTHSQQDIEVTSAAAVTSNGPCKDDDESLKYVLKDFNVEEDVIDEITCEKFKDSEIWRQEEFQPITGPGDTWLSYCKSILAERFTNNISLFPCGSTCGFCGGKCV